MDLGKLKALKPDTVSKILAVLAEAIRQDPALLADLIEAAQGTKKPLDIVKAHPKLLFQLLSELGAEGVAVVLGAI